MRLVRSVLLPLALIAVTARCGQSQSQSESLTLSDGTKVRYAVALPDDFDETRTYPTLLAFPPGSQDFGSVTWGMGSHWADQARARGYIVVSPASPNGEMFFAEAAAIFPEFLDRILENYPVERGRFHVVGVSNGGISAFHVAANHPEYFTSILTIPGFLRDQTEANYEAISSMCVVLIAGENDASWVGAARRVHEQLSEIGLSPFIEIVPGEGHVVGAYTGAGAAKLFDLIGDRAGCG